MNLKKKRQKGLRMIASFLDRANKILLYATIFLVPLIFSPFSFDVLELPKQSFLGVMVSLMLALWVIKMVFQRNFGLKRTPLDIPILIFAGVYLISALTSISPLVSILGFYGRGSTSFLSILFFVILYYLLVNNIKGEKEVTAIFLSLFVSAIFVSLLGLFQASGIFIIPATLTKTKVFNTIGTTNALAVFLMALIPFGLAQILRKESEVRLSFTVSTIFIFVLLILLNVKAAWLGISVSSIGGVVLLAKAKEVDFRRLVLPGIFALLSLVFLFFPTFGMNLPKEVVLDSKTARTQVVQVVKEKPIFGSGPETFVFGFSKYRPAKINQTQNWFLRFDKARSDWLHLLATSGVLGFVTYLFLLIVALVWGVTQFLKDDNENYKFLGLGALGAIVAISVSGIFYYTNYSLSLVFWLSLALLSFLKSEKEETQKEFDLKKVSLEAKVFVSTFLILLFLGSLYGIYFLSKAYVADVKYRRGLELVLRAKTLKDLKESERMLGKAVKINGLRENYHLSLARVLLIEANLENQKKKGKSLSRIQNLLAQAINEGKRAVNLNPQSVANWEGMALIYRNAALYATGALDWIELSYKKAQKLEPTNPILVNGLGQVSLTRGNMNQAQKFFAEAVSLKSDLPDPHFNLGLVYKDKGKYDLALESFKKYLKYGGQSAEANKEIEEIKKLKKGELVIPPAEEKLRGKPPAEIEKEKIQP